MRRFLRKSLIRLGILLNLLAMLVAMRGPILRGVGSFLMVSDPLEKADAIYVLAGNPTDRGREGAALLEQGWAPEAICTGGEWSGILMVMNIQKLHCDLTRMVMMSHGADSSRIRTVEVGSSTMEEYGAILKDAKARSHDKVIIVTSRLHTRRTRQVFRNRMRAEGITAIIHGADDAGMDEEHWWKNEDSLLFVNQEYIKMVYYWLKY